MDIKINEKTVRTMAEKLRGAAGLSQSKSYETLAQILGFKNWDTLSGVLKNKGRGDAEPHASASGVALKGPVELFMACHSPDEYASAPDYGKAELTQELIERIARMRKICIDNNLSECRSWRYIDWGGTDPDLDAAWNMELNEVVVTSSDVWFVAVPKHAPYHVETRAMSIDQLFRALSSRQAPCEYLVWHKGCLVYEPGQDLQYFIQMLEDAGEMGGSSNG